VGSITENRGEFTREGENPIKAIGKSLTIRRTGGRADEPLNLIGAMSHYATRRRPCFFIAAGGRAIARDPREHTSGSADYNRNPRPHVRHPAEWRFARFSAERKQIRRQANVSFFFSFPSLDRFVRFFSAIIALVIFSTNSPR